MKQKVLHNNCCQQHDHGAVLSLLSHFYSDSFSSHVIWVYIFVYVYIYNLAIFILFLLSSTVVFFLHCMLNILRYEKIFCETDEWIASQLDPSSDVIFWVLIVNPFSLLCSIFFFPENCVSFGLLVSCLSLSQSAQILLVNLLWGFS